MISKTYHFKDDNLNKLICHIVRMRQEYKCSLDYKKIKGLFKNRIEVYGDDKYINELDHWINDHLFYKI